jgi:hypothetical protein
VGFQVLHQSLENVDRFGRDSDHLIGFRTQCCTLGTGASVIVVQFQQFALLRMAGLFDDCQFQRRVMVGFNKEKKGARGDYPLFCTVAQTGQVLDGLHRSGNVHDSKGSVEFVTACVAFFSDFDPDLLRDL